MILDPCQIFFTHMWLVPAPPRVLEFHRMTTIWTPIGRRSFLLRSLSLHLSSPSELSPITIKDVSKRSYTYCFAITQSPEHDMSVELRKFRRMIDRACA